jgi:hypothetical protein
MTVDEVREYFGTLGAACRHLGIAVQNMTRWKKKNYVPWAQQFHIQRITEGRLQADPDDPRKLRREARCRGELTEE